MVRLYQHRRNGRHQTKTEEACLARVGGSKGSGEESCWARVVHCSVASDIRAADRGRVDVDARVSESLRQMPRRGRGEAPQGRLSSRVLAEAGGGFGAPSFSSRDGDEGDLALIL